MTDISDLVVAINDLNERFDQGEERINDNIFQFNANISALIEVLGLSVDQTLDFINASKRIFKERQIARGIISEQL